MHAREHHLILVTGASGKSGRRVVERLERRGAAVRAASRGGAVRFDWDDPATWGAALDGADAAYLAYSPDLAVPGAAATTGAFARAAADAGLRRLVLLSGRGEPAAQEAEAAVRDAGLETTVVRSAWFMQNFSEGAFRDGILGGELALPVGAMPEPFVDLDDVADAAVAALTEPGHAGRVHELTGPRALTFAAAVAEIAQAIGRPVAFASLPLDGFLAQLREEGTPEEAVGLLGLLFGELFDGRNAAPAGGVAAALGRPPRDFADWAREAAAAGAWAAAPAAGEASA